MFRSSVDPASRFFSLGRDKVLQQTLRENGRTTQGDSNSCNLAEVLPLTAGYRRLLLDFLD